MPSPRDESNFVFMPICGNDFLVSFQDTLSFPSEIPRHSTLHDGCDLVLLRVVMWLRTRDMPCFDNEGMSAGYGHVLVFLSCPSCLSPNKVQLF